MERIQEHRITEREAEFLAFVADGLTSQQIGSRSGIRPASVDRALVRAMQKLGAQTRVHAVAIAEVVGNTGSTSPPVRPVPLAGQERRVLELLAAGHTVSTAARLMHVSLRTAQRRLGRARRALGVSSTAAAIAGLVQRTRAPAWTAAGVAS